MTSNTQDAGTTWDASPYSGRRSFLKTATAVGIGGVAAGPTLCGGVRLALAPITLTAVGSGAKYTVTTIEQLTATPQRFDIVGDLHDAWMASPRQVLGSVFAFKDGERLRAFATICPHAGCAISFGPQKNPQSGTTEPLFFCPCHSAHFTKNGERLDQVSPRDLDELRTEVVDGKLCVTFARFLCGIAEKRQA